ncbi:CaiB/BaiF CoA transferase family protein [Fervidibacillus halotolerans]|uniref:CoA transferase n=1 Tax=Fervidibacillus halotolerans TaxID=2980027 RepID=A0A9E8LYI6_9BACI|nr:CaiB/BaiF CoA-transferase family protein [Fervidibacillus halotolerans]WAA12072.1 CoA transferase [Fervidibacillus halotolerans]
MFLPLSSIRVLDLTRLLPGPFATMVLADFGAEVIKIEDPKVGDYARQFEPKVDESSAIFHSLNRNKKSIILDLKKESGKDQFLKLVKIADVVIESFRPGVMERLGLGYQILKKVNPKLIYCAITGYGQTGPYAKMPGHDINFISYAGFLNINRGTDGKPSIPAVQIADLGGGAYPAIVGILLALFERERSGKGQFIDISMLDGVLAWMQTTLPNFFMKGDEDSYLNEFLTGELACYSIYQTKDDRWLSVGALEPKFWKVFCQRIGKTDLIPLLYSPQRKQEWMKAEIQSVISTKTLDEWMEIFKGSEACVSPVLRFQEMIRHPQIQARKMIERIGGERHTVQQIGIPIKLSETPGKIRSPAPKHGEHTSDILREIEEYRGVTTESDE